MHLRDVFKRIGGLDVFMRRIYILKLLKRWLTCFYQGNKDLNDASYEFFLSYD